MAQDGSSGVREQIQTAAVEAAVLKDLSGWPDTHRERFRALYSPIMDEVAERADDRGVDIEDVEAAYAAVVAGERHLTPHESVIRRTGMDYHAARQAAAVLSEIGDIHECYDDDWNLHWVRCDEYIRRKCEDRRISVCRYYQMYDTLLEFQDKVVGWFVRRNRRQSQPFQLRHLKERYVYKLQQQHFPEKPVEDEWSRHIAARYLRTAQDEIIRAYDLTY